MSKELAKVDENVVGKYLQERAKSLSGYALRVYDQEAFLKSAMLAINENDELKKCMGTEAGRTSVYHALRYAASTGLSLNPQMQKAALIAYSGKVQYQVMKSGMIDLAMDSGKIEFITADYVRENDVFDMFKSMDGDRYEFKPAKSDRGDVIGFFAAVKLKTGHGHVKWMTKEEVEEHRDKYTKMKGGPWTTSFTGMGVKTVLKSLLRNLNISPELEAAVASDDKQSNIVEVQAESHPVATDKGASAEDVKKQLEEQVDDEVKNPIAQQLNKRGPAGPANSKF